MAQNVHGVMHVTPYEMVALISLHSKIIEPPLVKGKNILYQERIWTHSGKSSWYNYISISETETVRSIGYVNIGSLLRCCTQTNWSTEGGGFLDGPLELLQNRHTTMP